MATIYVNGTAITENDEVYVNGSALAVGKSVYLNGSIVWTRQPDCDTSTSGTSYSKFSVTDVVVPYGGYAATGNPLYTKTVLSSVCSGSQCSIRVGAKAGSGDGFVPTHVRFTQNGTEVAYVLGTNTTQYLYSSIITRTINPGDVFRLEGYDTDSYATSYAAGDIWNGNNVSIF